MCEMSDMYKLLMAMRLAKRERVGLGLTYFDVIELLGEFDSLKSRIAELEAERRWIPVSERLPEDLQSIIVFTKDRKTYIIRFLELYGREGFGSLSDIVTHWMPLPESPESEE